MTEDEKTQEIETRVKETRIGMVPRLRSLRDVFTLSELQMVCDVSRETAYLYCSRWAAKGYIKRAGKNSGVYYNLFKNPKADTMLKEAIELALAPSAMAVISASALQENGFTTQNPKGLEVAVLVHKEQRTLPELYGVALIPRRPEWFRAVEGHLMDGRHDIPVLDPGYAIADGLLTKMPKTFAHAAWKPGPDDIQPPNDFDFEELADEVMEAAAAFGASHKQIAEIEDYIARIGDKIGYKGGYDR